MNENLTIHEVYAKENGNASINTIFDPEKMQLQSGGLTKREYFAGLAMQGILANQELQIWLFMDLKNDKKIFPNINHQNTIAIHAIKEADELLKQLEKTKEDGI